jgi:hypothetical protein
MEYNVSDNIVNFRFEKIKHEDNTSYNNIIFSF